MKRHVRGITILVFVLVSIASGVFAEEKVSWLTLREGVEKARAEHKPMIVDFFYGKGCPRCEALEREVYGDPQIAAKVMADFVPVRIDLSKKLTPEEDALGQKYEYKKDCLLVFLNADGDLVKGPGGKRLCFVDKVDPQEFIDYLDTVRRQAS